MVDVGNERVQRAHALLQAGLELGPLVGGEYAGNDVERDQALRAGVLTVHCEGDAHAVKQRVGLGALLCEALRRLLVEPLPIASAVQARRTRCIQHLVVRAGHYVAPIGVSKLRRAIVRRSARRPLSVAKIRGEWLKRDPCQNYSSCRLKGL